MKAKKLELKKEVIASLSKDTMARVVGGDVLGPTHAPSKCICLISEDSPCHTLGYDCLKVTEFPCEITDTCGTSQDCTISKHTDFPCKLSDACEPTELC